MAHCQLLVVKEKIKVAQSFVPLITTDIKHYEEFEKQLTEPLQKHRHELML